MKHVNFESKFFTVKTKLLELRCNSNIVSVGIMV
jgi:hypothetical protein